MLDTLFTRLHLKIVKISDLVNWFDISDAKLGWHIRWGFVYVFLILYDKPSSHIILNRLMHSWCDNDD